MNGVVILFVNNHVNIHHRLKTEKIFLILLNRTF